MQDNLKQDNQQIIIEQNVVEIQDQNADVEMVQAIEVEPKLSNTESELKPTELALQSNLSESVINLDQIVLEEVEEEENRLKHEEILDVVTK
jgi:hypothetical protein